MSVSEIISTIFWMLALTQFSVKKKRRRVTEPSTNDWLCYMGLKK